MTKLYTVISEIWHNRIRYMAGATIELTALQARYHVLAGRIEQFVAKVEAKVEAVVEAVEAPVAPKAKKAEADGAGNA